MYWEKASGSRLYVCVCVCVCGGVRGRDSHKVIQGSTGEIESMSSAFIYTSIHIYGCWWPPTYDDLAYDFLTLQWYKTVHVVAFETDIKFLELHDRDLLTSD